MSIFGSQEQLQPTCCIATCSSYSILSTSLKRRTFGRIVIWVLAVRLGDEIADRSCPIDLLRRLLGYRHHGRLVCHRGQVVSSAAAVIESRTGPRLRELRHGPAPIRAGDQLGIFLPWTTFTFQPEPPLCRQSQLRARIFSAKKYVEFQ
jgi:hypothetical protein